MIRAKILFYKEQGDSYAAIADRIDINIKSVKLCIDKYLDGSIERALYDNSRSGRPIEITGDAKSRFISVTCQKPCDFGYAVELWILSSLLKHIQVHAEETGYFPDGNIVITSWN